MTTGPDTGGKSYNFVHDIYPLEKHGYLLWNLRPDRKQTLVKHYSRIGNFHHPRHLILNTLSLRRMMLQA